MNYEGRLDLGIIHAVHPIFDGPGWFFYFSITQIIPRRTIELGLPTLKIRRRTYIEAVIGPHRSRFSSISRMSLSATNNTALTNTQISRNGTINGSHTRTSVVSCSYYLKVVPVVSKRSYKFYNGLSKWYSGWTVPCNKSTTSNSNNNFQQHCSSFFNTSDNRDIVAAWFVRWLGLHIFTTKQPMTPSWRHAETKYFTL